MRFQPGEGPSRGLLRYCEIFANLRLKPYLLLTSVQDMGVSMRMPMMMTGLMTSQAAVVSCTSHAPSPEQATSSAPCLPSRASSSVTTSTACQHQVWMRHLTTAIVTCYQLCQLEQAVDGDEAFVVQLGHGGVGGEPRPPL